MELTPRRGHAIDTQAPGQEAIHADDATLLAALRSGDEASFMLLVDRHHAAMVRVARGYVPTDAVAEEVAQEAWLGVLSGLAGFEGRSSLKSWVFRILVHCAMRRGQRERRTVPFSSLPPDEDPSGPSVPAERFLNDSHARWPGHWAAPPAPWAEARLLSRETLGLIRRAIEDLPKEQREVITLRDIEEWTAEEVCDALGLSEGNQRVLLHRARARVRRTLEEHMGETGGQT